MNKILFTLIFILTILGTNKAQQHKVSKTINWNNQLLLSHSDSTAKNYSRSYNPKVLFQSPSAHFESISFTEITSFEQEMLNGVNVNDEIKLVISSPSSTMTSVNYSFFPYRINPSTKVIEKVDQFTVQFELKIEAGKITQARSYSENSLLNSGNWFKIKIDTTGIFKLSYEQLNSIGLEKPENVRLYSYGGKQLSYANADYSHDDLVEIPIQMSSGSSSNFGTGDFILFYGQGPTTWEYDEDAKMFIHQTHAYSDFTYIFLTDQFNNEGLRIKEVDNSSLSSEYTSTTYDSYKYHEIDSYNLIKSGRTWYGDKFRTGDNKTFTFSFPNIVSTEELKVKSAVIGRKQLAQTCYFKITENGTNYDTITVSQTYGSYNYGTEYNSTFTIKNPSTIHNLKYSFTGASSDMEGYIDYICLNARENLVMQNSQLAFCDKVSADSSGIWKFNIQNNGKNISVWNVSNTIAPYALKLNQNGNTSSFNINADTLHQFIAFDEQNFFTPIVEGDDIGAVANQNLHGVPSVDMVIVTYPSFINQAEELAEIHTKDDLSVYVTQPQLIYNEFSSGATDVSAIRNFMRMLYDKADDNNKPKYLLLIGDGSYDNKGIKTNYTPSLIPTYQSIESLNELVSYVSDDFYGLLDLDEGEIEYGGGKKIVGFLDLGIGRFPVISAEETELIINKIKYYKDSNSFGDWKTNICFVGDDEDYGIHAQQPEDIDRNVLRVNNPEFNVNKIFLDAYQQTSTPSGQSYPDVTEAINKTVDKGVLILDYVGHGNPRILAHEEILKVSDIRSWKNLDKLPLFVTASCEVGRYDDPEQRSFGEWLLMHSEGGGIGALTTTRVVFSGANDRLNTAFFEHALNPNLRLGDVIRLAKNDVSSTDINHRNFSLLGDPALKLAVPRNKLIVGNINNNTIADNPFVPDNQKSYSPGDTLYALSKALIEGYIDDYEGNPIYDSGTLQITIFDKTDTLYTLGNDSKGRVVEFIVQDKILYKGKASITNGAFSFEFIVPKDINYKYGKGKISLYAVLDSNEAIGYSDNIIIGSSADDVALDIEGPQIELFMNDYGFKNGGATNENPILLAKLKDENGINTTGNGFGHNITAVLDDNQDQIYILNNYYEGDLDKYNSGEVHYPFYDLEPGHHSLTFKVFDIYNNSSESSIEFYVYESTETVIENLQNTPNPFYDETYFTFEHNQSYEDFSINIKIYDSMGNQVSEINETNSNPGYKTTPIYWDGTSPSGAKLPNGLYIYRVELTSLDGEKTYESSKLMIFK